MSGVGPPSGVGDQPYFSPEEGEDFGLRDLFAEPEEAPREMSDLVQDKLPGVDEERGSPLVPRHMIGEKIAEGGWGSIYRLMERVGEQLVATSSVLKVAKGEDPQKAKEVHEQLEAYAVTDEERELLKHFLNVHTYTAVDSKGNEVKGQKMEFCDGDNIASDAVCALTLEQKKENAEVILRGMQFLHKNRFVHLDINRGNFLYKFGEGVKFTDLDGMIRKKSAKENFKAYVHHMHAIGWANICEEGLSMTMSDIPFFELMGLYATIEELRDLLYTTDGDNYVEKKAFTKEEQAKIKALDVVLSSQMERIEVFLTGKTLFEHFTNTCPYDDVGLEEDPDLRNRLTTTWENILYTLFTRVETPDGEPRPIIDAFVDEPPSLFEHIERSSDLESWDQKIRAMIHPDPAKRPSWADL